VAVSIADVVAAVVTIYLEVVTTGVTILVAAAFASPVRAVCCITLAPPRASFERRRRPAAHRSCGAGSATGGVVVVKDVAVVQSVVVVVVFANFCGAYSGPATQSFGQRFGPGAVLIGVCVINALAAVPRLLILRRQHRVGVQP